MKSLLGLALALCMLLALAAPAAAVSDSALSAAVTDSAAYMLRTVKNPQVGSIGGEWAVLGLARSGFVVPEQYFQDYYATVESYVKACNGVLHEKKYTEYSRLILALTSIGKDARNVAGYDLTTALGDYDKTIWQGLNGPIWALIALDSGNYPMPQNPQAKTQATRQMYVDCILSRQRSDGGWSLTTGEASSDPDMTGMALQALAKYQDQAAVSAAIDRALACVSNMQKADGGFASWGTANSESAAQIIVGLCELGVSLDDARFVKNGKSALDNLMSYAVPGGGFKHTADGSGSNQMAAEQGFYAIVAAQRAMQGKNSLYRMSDAITISGGASDAAAGLPGKHADVQAAPVVNPGKAFDDVVFHDNRPAIEALAARGIINGKTDTLFDPDANMTRAEFATIVVRALGLTAKANGVFADVPADQWYAAFVGTAYTYGIVNGVSETQFNPNGTITRQEAAVMVARAAKLCGMNTAMTAANVRDVLAQFSDYTKSADWAREGLAFCYDNGILDDSAVNIQPTVAIHRCEIAQMLFNLLGSAKLL